MVKLTLVSRNHKWEQVPPRTKKNSGQIVTVNGRQVLLPSKDYLEWEKGCIVSSAYDRMAPAITFPVNCKATIYRDRNVGDAVGYYQAIGDCLEKMGIVQNDRLIVSWDGTRLDKDPSNPRVEIELTPAEGEAIQMSLLGPSVSDVVAVAKQKRAERRARRQG